MAIKTKTELEAIWITGYVPTQSDYVDLFDTVFNGQLQQPIIIKCFISQTGTSEPTIGISGSNSFLLNNSGEIPVFSYIETGVYSFQFPSLIWDLGKASISISPNPITGEVYTPAPAFGLLDNGVVGQIIIYTDNNIGVPTNDLLLNQELTITIYP